VEVLAAEGNRRGRPATKLDHKGRKRVKRLKRPSNTPWKMGQVRSPTKKVHMGIHVGPVNNLMSEIPPPKFEKKQIGTEDNSWGEAYPTEKRGQGQNPVATASPRTIAGKNLAASTFIGFGQHLKARKKQ